MKKKIFFVCFFLFIFLIHQTIFLDFFPNSNGFLGHDYEQYLPNFIFGKIWFKNNFLSIPWFTPSFCCGTPFYPDPQTMYYSFQQIFYIIFEPLLATKIMFIYFSLLGYLGMFFLLKKHFNTEKYISLLGATVFIFNGFFVYRAIIGHVAYLSFILVPLYCFFLFESISNQNKFLRQILILISALILSSFIYSGTGPIMPILMLCISSIVLFYYIKNSNFLKILKTFLTSSFIALLISISKISSSLFFLKIFPREYTPLFFSNIVDYFKISLKSLFFFPDIETFNEVVINKVTTRLNLHEIEYGVSIVPLIVFIIFLINVKKFYPFIKNFRNLLILFFVLVLPILFNIILFQNIIEKIPIIKSSWVQIRWTIIYILPIIFFTVLTLNNLEYFKKKTYLTIFFLLVLILQNIYYNKNYYQNQKYNPERMVKFFNKIDSDNTGNYSIKKIGTFYNNDTKKISNFLLRNDFFVDDISAIFCYQPIFGYDSNKFPSKKLVVNQKYKINENVDLLTGELILKNSENQKIFNFLDPSCFIFPSENNCKPGDLFNKNKEKDFVNLINYKEFKFNKNYLQTIFDYLSLIVFLIVIISIIINFYFYRVIKK